MCASFNVKPSHSVTKLGRWTAHCDNDEALILKEFSSKDAGLAFLRMATERQGEHLYGAVK